MNKVLFGDCRESMAILAEQGVRVQMCVTSPPYYDQRDYGVGGQIGQETTPEAYVAELVDVFKSVKEILSDDGVLWLNLGDKYKNGNLLGMPWRVALALQADGWLLRSDVIWHKPNAMPSSVKNRPTTDHEYIFLLAKKGEYYYDADAVREPHVTFSPESKMKGGRKHLGGAVTTPEAGKNAGNSNLHTGDWTAAFHPLGRNKRTVWSIGLGKYKGAHFAVFPEKLVETCILSGSRVGDIVLDPFLGSGTTAAVAIKHGRQYIGCELNEAYGALQTERIRLAVSSLPA